MIACLLFREAGLLEEGGLDISCLLKEERGGELGEQMPNPALPCAPRT
jgi:hypothetical protein